MKPRRILCQPQIRALLPALSALALFACDVRAQTAAPENRFEKNVRAYETADQLQPPPQGAILLAGDSQFFRWKTLNEDLPGYTIINRGIDSFQTSDLVYYADRLILRYKPRMIVLHVGGNDVHNGVAPEQVVADFKMLVERIRAAMPEVPIAFTSVTPGPGRWSEAAQRIRANHLISAYIASQPHLQFINLWDVMLTPDGKPREDIWMPDRVHSNHAGYMIRVAVMLPILGRPDQIMK